MNRSRTEITSCLNTIFCAHGSEKLATALGARYKYSREQKSN